MICSLLNSGGGNILLGVVNENLRATVKGDMVSELQKEQIEQQITYLLKYFVPKINI